MRKIGLCMLILSLVFFVVACGGQSTSTTNNENTASENTQKQESNNTSDANKNQTTEKKTETLTVWAYDYLLGENSALEKAKTSFEEQNPSIKIKFQPVVYGTTSYRDKFITQASGGAGPDVILSDVAWVPQLASMGLLKSIDTEAEGVVDQFFDGPLKTVTFEGQLYGLPWEASPMAIYYNKDAFRAANLDPDNPPTTWEEFRAAAETLTKDGKYGFAYMGGWGGSFDWLPFLWQSGGDILNDTYTQAELNSPDAVRSVEYFFGMVEDKVIPPAALTWKSWDELNAAFGAGLISMYQSGPWSLASLKKADLPFEWGVYQSPKGKRQATVLGGTDWVINKNSTFIESSYKWLEFITSEESLEVLSDMNRISARKDNKEQSIFNDPHMKAFIESIEFAKARPPIPQWTQIDYDVIQPALLEIVHEGKSAQKAMDEAEKKANEILSNR